MCSVVGCYSRRRTAQRFKLPEDPERRLEWVQFLAAANKQRFKESSWTDITICSEHFKDDCFENLTPSHSGVTGKVQLTLKPSAVPSLCVQSEADEPEPHLERPQCVEPMETTEATYQGELSLSEESTLSSTACGSPVPRGVSTDAPDVFMSVYGQMHPRNVNIDLIREKAALLQMKGKYVVNEKRLLQLFSCKCPLCGSKVTVEKVTDGLLIILNQQCLQCEYRNQWKSQVNASVPSDEDQHLTGGSDVTPEMQQASTTDDTHGSTTGVPEIVAVIDDESDTMDETEESGDQGDMDSDEDWKPAKHFLLARGLEKETDDTTKNEEEERYDYPSLAPKHSQLCTECGMFFSKQRSHTCEHKVKPYSCNICGKRCVSEVALNCHSRVHNENYEHRCKYCHVTFKTKVDKHSHEQTHLTEGKPYKCPDCSETFATNKDRSVHLEDHRGPRKLKCDICGIQFVTPLSLQRHLAVHTGVRPFKCSVCERGFNQASHLKSHMRLHTGERPYKCQHCDKCFNHNVSLKSHVQRYHTSVSGCEQKKEKINKRESDTGDAEGNESKKSTNSDLDNGEEEQDTEEEVQKETAGMPKNKKRSTGRPIGRPKRNEPGNLVLAVQVEGQCSKTETGKKLLRQKLKRAQCSELSDSDTSFDSAGEEEERSEEVTSSASRSRGRGKVSDSDSDFDPEERKKKRCSSQNSGKSFGKRKGKPRKNLVV
ncbi:uncharacterized protein LOC143329159 [Chaetodon auriga]|uniref:uncharacterized protein LOC143329159 n=1 Tax=Chaetodon auriga TaxID=39042 RepID=UPI0040329DD4